MKATSPSQIEPHEQSQPGLEGTATPWRPIHYLGSKLRALSSIEQALGSVAPHGSRVYDLFAGSGTVSRWLARHRPVTAVDVQEYSRVICSALLNPSAIDLKSVEAKINENLKTSKGTGSHFVAEPLIALEEEAIQLAARGEPTLLADLLDAGSVTTFDSEARNKSVREAFCDAQRRFASLKGTEQKGTMMLRHFGGLYFSFRQAAEIDTLLSFAHAEPELNRDVLIAAALTCASELVNTVGKQFAQPIRPRNKQGQIKSNLYGLVARDRFRAATEIFHETLKKYTSLSSARSGCHAVRSDYSDFLSSDGFGDGVVYADPPYTRDHYSRFYHVLETMSLWDDPAISTNTVRGRTKLSRGAYREGRHQSPFCIRSQAPKAFDQMFQMTSIRNAPVVVSYSPYAAEKGAHPRVMTIDAIREIAFRHYSQVEIASVGDFFHSKLNRSDLNKEIAREAEFLILCKGSR